MKNTNCLTFRNLNKFSITNGVSTATVAYDYANEAYVLCWDWGMQDGKVVDSNYVHYIPDGQMEAFKEALGVDRPEANYSYLSHDTEAWLNGFKYEVEEGEDEIGEPFRSERVLFQQSENDLGYVDNTKYMK